MPSPTHTVPAAGRTGCGAGAPGLIVRECVGLSLASVIAKRGCRDRAVEAALAAFGARLPLVPRAIVAGGLTFVWAGPGQWLVESAAVHEDFEAFLATAFGDAVAICEQSDSRITLDVSGPRVRDVLAKGVPIDLHPAAFRDGDVALTAVAQVGVQLRQTSAAPAYRLTVARSYLGSFWYWMASSAAEFGCEVSAPDADNHATA